MSLGKLKSNDFSHLRNNGKTFKTLNLLFVYQLTKSPEDKVNTFKYGFTVTRKAGKAFLRNRMKRLLRESLRSLLKSSESYFSNLETDLNLNIVVFPKNAEELSYSDVCEQVQFFFDSKVFNK